MFIDKQKIFIQNTENPCGGWLYRSIKNSNVEQILKVISAVKAVSTSCLNKNCDSAFLIIAGLPVKENWHPSYTTILKAAHKEIVFCFGFFAYHIWGKICPPLIWDFFGYQGWKKGIEEKFFEVKAAYLRPRS